MLYIILTPLLDFNLTFYPMIKVTTIFVKLKHIKPAQLSATKKNVHVESI